MTVSNMSGGTASVVFPDQEHQTLSVLVHLLGVFHLLTSSSLVLQRTGSSVLAACFARRFSLSNMNLAKYAITASRYVMLMFPDSAFLPSSPTRKSNVIVQLLVAYFISAGSLSSLVAAQTVLLFFSYIFSAGLVVNGIGMSLNLAACLSGIYLCIFLSVFSHNTPSFLIILQLRLEQGPHLSLPRRKGSHRLECWPTCQSLQEQSVACLLCSSLRLHYSLHLDARRSVSSLCCLALLTTTSARIGYIKDDHTCVIGLGSLASIPLLTYDCFLNLFLTGLFVWPLMRRQLSTGNLRALATRTCWYEISLLTYSR